MMVPENKFMDIGLRAYEQFCNQQYNLHLNNVTIEDNGAYEVKITYTEITYASTYMRDESVVIGTIKLYINGKIFIASSPHLWKCPLNLCCFIAAFLVFALICVPNLIDFLQECVFTKVTKIN